MLLLASLKERELLLLLLLVASSRSSIGAQGCSVRSCRKVTEVERLLVKLWLRLGWVVPRQAHRLLCTANLRLTARLLLGRAVKELGGRGLHHYTIDVVRRVIRNSGAICYLPTVTRIRRRHKHIRVGARCLLHGLTCARVHQVGAVPAEFRLAGMLTSLLRGLRGKVLVVRDVSHFGGFRRRSRRLMHLRDMRRRTASAQASRVLKGATPLLCLAAEDLLSLSHLVVRSRVLITATML